ncbi:hypothetical protein Bbad01_26050 [Bacillus badius]|nr:hypothetical protein Bbad01_26050 [Bacillus badius]
MWRNEYEMHPAFNGYRHWYCVGDLFYAEYIGSLNGLLIRTVYEFTWSDCRA